MALERGVERELMRKCLAGETRFYEPVVRAYEGPALRVATGMMGDRDAARDAVQDAFVRAWEALDDYDPERPFGPWFFRILRNRCRDLLRSRSSRRDREDRAARRAEDDGRTVPDGRRARERSRRRERVWEALDRLDPDHREVLVLKELEGMSYREIAGVLEIPDGTVGSRLHHAREALRRELEAMGVEYP